MTECKPIKPKRDERSDKGKEHICRECRPYKITITIIAIVLGLLVVALMAIIFSLPTNQTVEQKADNQTVEQYSSISNANRLPLVFTSASSSMSESSSSQVISSPEPTINILVRTGAGQ